MKKLMVSALALLVLAACSSTPTDKTDVAGPATNSNATSDASKSASTAAVDSGDPKKGIDPLRDPNNILSKRNVYFDLDSFTVRDEYKGLIGAHAKYLAGNRAARMTVQGNADERGSREYNIALGQKRAEAVKKQILLQGVSEGQMETVSFGKEKPKAQGHDEAAWAENRRADIVYSGE